MDAAANAGGGKRAIITVARQMGSAGREVARLVAERLGYRLVWREVINQAARRGGAPEAALAVIDELGLLGIQPSDEEYEAYRLAVQQVILELAEQGNLVIVGRAGQAILAGRPDTLHVRLIAPLELRAQRVADWQKISLESARAQIETSDRYRRKYLRRFYDQDWDDPNLYDLIINTGRLSLQQAAELICAAAQGQVQLAG